MDTTKRFEVDEQCQACGGTGLYVSMAERDGAAVVCYKCKGTGCFHFTHEYTPFVHRREREDVTRVVQGNPGIVISGAIETYVGGQSFVDWKAGQPMPPKSEMRLYTCPAWWYQTVDYKLKPEWNECFDSLGHSFSKCPHFEDKAKCWERWDAEHGMEARSHE